MIKLEPEHDEVPVIVVPRIPVTIMKRRQHFAHYERWLITRGLRSDHPSASAIAAYIEDYAWDISYPTQRNRVESIRMTYLSRGISWPENDSAIRWALESVRDRMGARASRPLSDDELSDLANSMVTDKERDVHDRALILGSCQLGLEASQVIRLRVDDLRFDGVDEVTLVGFGFSRAKVKTAYAHTDARRCPVRALRVWIDTRDASQRTLFYHNIPSGSMRPLLRRDVNGIVMRRMSAIGRTAKRYSAQSMTAYGLFGRAVSGVRALH